ncbi:MAG: histidine kinase [Bryobacteraceae bacterium]|nr:histidine kinase [Bryobacteraceae bacterium]
MPELLNIHEPLLINSIGHSAGAVVFGLLLILLLRDSWVRRTGVPGLAAGAALLAVGWNAGSLIALSPWFAGSGLASAAAAIGFACLSLLPALLLAISLKGAARSLRVVGWLASTAAVLLHLAELVTHHVDLHRLGLLLIAVVFAVLALLSIWRVHAGAERRRLLSGVLVPLALILFAGSFVHFGESHSTHLWSEEIALHHAGIPLAVFIVLQDYRFLLMDAFVRFLASGGLAAGLTLAWLAADEKWRLLERSAADPFLAGVLITGACCALVLFAALRSGLQAWLTRRVFRRPSLQTAISRLIEKPAVRSEQDLLNDAARAIAGHVNAERMELRAAPSDSTLLLPEIVTGTLPDAVWADVIVPLRFSRGDAIYLLLGRRAGGRRYLSEDIRDLVQLALVVVSQIERFRSEHMERLATEAELKALHAQINPHFLFNSLNALYGTIPRSAEGARRTVLNLADVFRYFLQTDGATIALSEELRIVKAYLEIEQLRLGDRLQVRLDVDPRALDVRVPPLCIQPLVENGIRHGIAATPGPGFISLTVAWHADRISVEVRDSGAGFRASAPTRGNGIGLDNVRQRLSLMYGSQSELTVTFDDTAGTRVAFEVPAPCAIQVSR